MILVSDLPYDFVISPGDCEAIEHQIKDKVRHLSNKETISRITATQVIKILNNTKGNQKSEANGSFVTEVDSNTSWMPIILLSTTPPLKKVNRSTEIFEPVISVKQIKDELVQPIVRVKSKRENNSTILKVEHNLKNRSSQRGNDMRSFKLDGNLSNIEQSTNSTKILIEHSTDPKSIVVQLFPHSIASMFVKAENYARQTFLPYLTEQFPSFFKDTIDNNDETRNIKNKIKYIQNHPDSLEVQTHQKRAFRSTSVKLLNVEHYLQYYKNFSGIKNMYEDDRIEHLRKIKLPFYTFSGKNQNKSSIYIPLVRTALS